MRKQYVNLEGRAAFAERNDCTVVAVAAAAEVSYAEAHAFLAANGRKPRRGMYFSQFMAGRTELLGWKVVEEHPATLTGGRAYPTLARVAARYRKGRYIAVKRGHAFAIVEGTVVDATRMGGRARVINMWRLEKPEAAVAPVVAPVVPVIAPVAPVAPAEPMPWAVKKYFELRAAGNLEAAVQLFNAVTPKVQQLILAAQK